MLLMLGGSRALEAAVSGTFVSTRAIPGRDTLVSANGATGQPDQKIEVAFLDTVGYFYCYISTFLTRCLFCLVLLFKVTFKVKFEPVKQNDHLNFHLKHSSCFAFRDMLLLERINIFHFFKKITT